MLRHYHYFDEVNVNKKKSAMRKLQLYTHGHESTVLTAYWWCFVACNPSVSWQYRQANAKRTLGMRQQKMPRWKCVVSASHVSWSVVSTRALTKCWRCWAHEEISRTRGCGHSFLTPGVKLRFSTRWLWHWASGISCPRVSIAAIRSSQTSHSPQRSWHYLVRKTHCLKPTTRENLTNILFRTDQVIPNGGKWSGTEAKNSRSSTTSLWLHYCG